MNMKSSGRSDECAWQLAKAACASAGYPVEASTILFEGLSYAIARVGRTVSAKEILAGIATVAVDEFGMLARAVLDENGLRDASDVGRVVHAMVGVGLLTREEDDTIDAFLRCGDLLASGIAVGIVALQKKWAPAW